MKGYTGVLPSGEAIHYVDRKRWLWLLSVAYPLQPFIAVFLHYRTGNEFWFLLPFIGNYIVAPLLDWAIGEDRNNPPEEVVPQLESDPYYRWATYALVPVLWIAFLGNAYFVGTRDLPWTAVAAIAVNVGILCGFGINLGHELGHKKSKLERRRSRVCCWPHSRHRRSCQRASKWLAAFDVYAPLTRMA